MRKGERTINFRQLEYILAVAQEGNVTRAAQKLHIAQPSLSQTIRTVEEEVGGPLFQRRSRPLKPTYIGERYLDTARKILRMRDDFFYELAELHGGNDGRILVGISLRRSRDILSELFLAFTNRFPKVHIQLIHEKSAALEKMLLQGEVDIAFMNYKSIYPKLESRLLCTEELLLAVSYASPLFPRLKECQQYSVNCPDSQPISPLLLSKAPLVLLQEGIYSRDQCDQMFRAENIQPNIYMETGNTELALSVAEATGTAAIFPRIVKAKGDLAANLALYRIDSQHVRRNLYLVRNKARYISPAQESFFQITLQLMA